LRQLTIGGESHGSELPPPTVVIAEVFTDS